MIPVNAIALFGDPRHMAYQQYNRGTPGNESTFGVSGKYPRTEFQLDYLNAHYASKLRDYCNPGDHVCAQGDDIVVHVDEVPDLSAAAAE
ncbi:Cutinase [Macrophomina phaseolina MS6]|uniref:Cutinase n=1 Tax=Macrophomina phaseolina (strain MS6) TaxID=1126212 RepID=K2RLU6_MACPH|nr:Cutinase [Macrophomina phaseolina MS6]